MLNSRETKLSLQEIKDVVKGYLLEELLRGADPEELTDSMPLLTSGILDSLATTRLTLFLEERFQIQLKAHETMVDYLNTLTDIAELVDSKL